MTVAIVLRVLAAAAAGWIGRMKRPGALVPAGLLAGFAVFGTGPSEVPDPAAAALAVLAILVLALAVTWVRWLPITEDGVLSTFAFGLPAGAVAAVSVRGEGALVASAAGAFVFAAISLFSAEMVRAAAESGGRKIALAIWALVLPPVLAAAAAASASPAPRLEAGTLLAAALAVAILAWIPALLVERARLRRELEGEVQLGFLPPDDAVALELPWRRLLEKRFGRPDERREYIRSALLLAVARAQQRRRSGEAERMRQLEILTFRTRLRRTLEARTLRTHRPESGEFGVPDPARGEEGDRGNPIGVPPDHR
ncbi:MAG: hypothetical protein ACHQPI_05560 [Thermoanaerobaculia bacterium]